MYWLRQCTCACELRLLQRLRADPEAQLHHELVRHLRRDVHTLAEERRRCLRVASLQRGVRLRKSRIDTFVLPGEERHDDRLTCASASALRARRAAWVACLAGRLAPSSTTCAVGLKTFLARN